MKADAVRQEGIMISREHFEFCLMQALKYQNKPPGTLKAKRDGPGDYMMTVFGYEVFIE